MTSEEEPVTIQPCALHWLEVLRRTERCKWCGDAKSLNKAGLCGSCKKNERDLAKAKKNVETMSPTEHRHQAFLLGLELEWAESKKELCQANGEELETILNGKDFSTYDLEQWLCQVSAAVCHDGQLHGGTAGLLGEAFSPDQRRVFAYLLWKMLLVDDKRMRTFKARIYSNSKKVLNAENDRK